jgi:hypothetical protein
MVFSYKCVLGHAAELSFAVGMAPREVLCPIDEDVPHLTLRDYAADFSSQQLDTGDPFRSYHLSAKKDSAAVTQQRHIEGPTDNFERKRIEAATGRRYIGNDTDGMTKNARAAIDRLGKKK